jgi:iron only hydrogenase large subunit-like protein
MYPGCVTCFIGPCDAKLAEAIDCPHTDYALTFSETYAMIRAKSIPLEEVRDAEGQTTASQGHAEGRGFAITGGVSTAVAAFAGASPAVPVQPVIVDGLNPDSVKKLRSFAKRPPPGNLIEIMACSGGCCGGPGAAVPVNVATAKVKMVVAKSPSHSAATKVATKPVIIRGDTVIMPDGK